MYPNNLDCTPSYHNPSNDYAEYAVACGDYCNNTCNSTEVCYISGPSYSQGFCKQALVCLTSVSSESLGASPTVTFSGENLDLSTTYSFGTIVVTGCYSFFGFVQCPIPSNSSATGKTVFVTSFDLNDPTCGVYFTFPGASGLQDPHFKGFHGERLEIERDHKSANHLFHLYCSPSITVTTLFFEYPDERLFMTKFWVRLGTTKFTLNLSSTPKVLTPHKGPFLVATNSRYRIYIPGGHLEWGTGQNQKMNNSLLQL